MSLLHEGDSLEMCFASKMDACIPVVKKIAEVEAKSRATFGSFYEEIIGQNIDGKEHIIYVHVLLYMCR